MYGVYRPRGDYELIPTVTRRPASADRTARAANFSRGGTYRQSRTLIDGYLESPFPTARLL